VRSSISLSARATKVAGTSTPIALAAFRLITSSNLSGCCTGMLAGFSPRSVIHEEPTFSEMFIAHLLGRAIRVEADLVDQLFNSSEKRLARNALAVGELRQGRDTRAGDREDQPGDACGDDRNDAVACKFLHEQI